MKRVFLILFLVFTIVGLFLVPQNNVQAQTPVCSENSITEWTITPSQITIPPAGQITVTVQGFQGIDAGTELTVAVEPGYDANNNFQPIAEDTIQVGGIDTAILSIPPLTPEGTYSVVIGDLQPVLGSRTLFVQCSSPKTLAVTSSYEPPEGEECLTLGDRCAVFRPGDVPEEIEGLTWPLCSASLTYCKLDSTFGWIGTVTAKGNQLSPCLYNPESEGDKYYCTAGIPGSQDENCTCYQEQLDRTIGTADIVGLGCEPAAEGFVNTGIGCIPYQNINQTTAFLIRWTLGVGGGISLLLISVSAIKIMTTKGDPKRLQDARDTFSAAIGGLLMAVLSVFLVRFITETLLRIF